MKKLIITNLLIATAISTNAATIANFNFNSGTTSSDTEINSTATFAPIPNAANAGRSGDGNAFIRATATGTDLAAALADTDVFTVTITADAGFQFNLTSINFDFGGKSDTTAYVTNGVVYSGGVTLHDEAFSVVTGGGTSYDTGNSDSLAAASFQGVTSATFTFANYDNTGVASNTNRWDNITIEGDVVAVPEPSSTALLGLGGLALILRRRK